MLPAGEGGSSLHEVLVFDIFKVRPAITSLRLKFSSTVGLLRLQDVILRCFDVSTAKTYFTIMTA